MYNNSFSDESLGAQPTEAYPPMEELQPRPSQQPPAHTPPPGESTAHPVPLEEVEEVEARQEEALTIKYAIGKLNYYLIFWALRRFLRILISSPEEPTE